jgi:hypothetical protein
MATPSNSNTQAPVRKLDRQRLKEVVEETSKWPAYMRGEVGSKAPSRIETRTQGSSSESQD